MRVQLDIEDRRIADLLCNAFEGGSNYWYRIEEFIEPPAGNLYAWDTSDQHVYRHIQYPLSIGGALLVSDFAAAWEDGDECKTCGRGSDDARHDDPAADDPADDNRHSFMPKTARTERLDRESIARGLQLFAQGAWAKHFGAWMSDNDDAVTADVFLQLCLFGDVVYG